MIEVLKREMSGVPPKDRSCMDFFLSLSQGEPGHTE